MLMRQTMVSSHVPQDAGQRPAHPGHRRRSHDEHVVRPAARAPRTPTALTRRARRRPAARAPRTPTALTRRTRRRPAARAPRTPTARTRRARRRPAARAPRAKIPKNPTCNRIQLLAYPMIARLSSMIESSVCHHAGVVHNNIREEL